MYCNQKIGIGILTCNRPKMFGQLLKSVQSLENNDIVAVVKNKNYDYGEFDPVLLCPDCTIAIEDDIGVGACKNAALKRLLSNGCEHIFLVEDDVKIKRNDVLEAYIDTAKEFNIEHLNFGNTYDSLLAHSFLTPYLTLKHGNYAIDLYRRLSGVFEYFTSNSLKTVGLIDEKYVNALEHCEHTYKMSLAGLTTPFYSFADIHNSNEYLEDLGISTTIVKNDIYKLRLHNAFKRFEKQHNISISKIPVPTNQQVVDYLDKRLDLKKGN